MVMSAPTPRAMASTTTMILPAPQPEDDGSLDPELLEESLDDEEELLPPPFDVGVGGVVEGPADGGGDPDIPILGGVPPGPFVGMFGMEPGPFIGMFGMVGLLLGG